MEPEFRHGYEFLAYLPFREYLSLSPSLSVNAKWINDPKTKRFDEKRIFGPSYFYQQNSTLRSSDWSEYYCKQPLSEFMRDGENERTRSAKKTSLNIFSSAVCHSVDTEFMRRGLGGGKTH